MVPKTVPVVVTSQISAVEHATAVAALPLAAGTSFAAALLAWTTIRDDALSRPAARHHTSGETTPGDCAATLRSRRDPTGHLPPPAAGQGVLTVR